MRINKALGLGAIGALTLAASAVASPITTAPPSIAVNGNVKIVYIGASAGDHSSLSLVGGLSNIFCNNAVGSCSGTASGTVADLGNQTGTLDFTLNDVTIASVYSTSGTAADGYYHAKVTTNYADLGVFAMPDDAASVIDGLLDSASIVYYVGFEDRLHGDYDYNDFVFAVVDPPVSPVPEPVSISLAGAGLAGMGLMRRRKTRV